MLVVVAVGVMVIVVVVVQAVGSSGSSSRISRRRAAAGFGLCYLNTFVYIEFPDVTSKFPTVTMSPYAD
jgi:hypothetical protein